MTVLVWFLFVVPAKVVFCFHREITNGGPRYQAYFSGFNEQRARR